MNWVGSQGATLQLQHAGHPHHIKFNFQSGLCDNLQNDVFISIFCVTLHFGMSLTICRVHTHDTFIIILDYSSNLHIRSMHVPITRYTYTKWLNTKVNPKGFPLSLFHSMEQR